MLLELLLWCSFTNEFGPYALPICIVPIVNIDLPLRSLLKLHLLLVSNNFCRAKSYNMVTLRTLDAICIHAFTLF
eukprot:jgi/Psemu1/302537/fgenesh1_kg.72_\